MDLLGVDGKGEKDALAILTKFSADHCQVSFLKQALEIKSHKYMVQYSRLQDLR